MNGSEVETRAQHKTPVFGEPPELTDSEKMDLVAGDDTPFARAIYKLMEREVFNAQREAIKTKPSNKEEQLANMTIAHAVDKFYTDLRAIVLFEKTSHITDIKALAAKKELEETGRLEEIVLAQSRGEL